MGDYGFYITCDQSMIDNTEVVLSKRKDYKIDVIDFINSKNKLPEDIYKEYIFKHCKNKASAFKEFNELSMLLTNQTTICC